MEGKRTALLFSFAIPIISVFLMTQGVVREKWPDVPIKPEYATVVEKALTEYKDLGINYKSGLQSYDSFGDYLNWGITKNYRESDTMKFDDDGIPMLKYGDDFHYNPGTVIQFALVMHGKYVRGNQDPTRFLNAVEKVIELQSEDGSFGYPFRWRYYLLEQPYEPGWFSGMDSGQALSVFSRAYHLTRDEKYIEHGRKALEHMVKPISEGGTMDTLEDLDESLKNYIIFEEYLADPAGYTLNGFMFSLLGLYDWSQIESDTQKEAEKYFKKGIRTLEKIIPYYDIGGFSAYDLGHITYNKLPHYGVGYHAIHIQFCNIFYQLTGKDIFMEYFKKWSAYVDM